MKKHILLGVICLLTLSSINAQQNSQTQGNDNKPRQTLTVEQRVNNQTDKAAKELNLSDDQKQKWAAASLERIKLNEPLKQQMQGSTTPEQRKDIRQQMRANNQKFDQTVSTFLNADQKTKYETMKQNHRGNKQHMRGGHKKVDTATMPNDINKN